MRVLIVDDQDYIRRWLKALLAQEPDIQVCGEAQDGRDAINMVEKLLPDVVIMDISMPVVDGLQATRVIREFFPKVQVVTVSQYELVTSETFCKWVHELTCLSLPSAKCWSLC